MAKRKRDEPGVRTSWDPLAAWYDGWVGEEGSDHHQKLAIPAVLELLALDETDRVLDVGAGQGVLAPYIAETGAAYTGVEAGGKLIEIARRRHKGLGNFIVGDARRLESLAGVGAGVFSAVVFLLSLQDMDPLGDVLRGAAWALKPGGRLVALLTHPCFRIPRQSGWGWDEGRKLQYRRVDRYLTPLPVPLKPYPGQRGVSRSFHRPLHEYVNGLATHGLAITKLVEIPTYKRVQGERSKAINRANEEIPLFLGLRAEKRK